MQKYVYILSHESKNGGEPIVCAAFHSFEEAVCRTLISPINSKKTIEVIHVSKSVIKIIKDFGHGRITTVFITKTPFED